MKTYFKMIGMCSTNFTQHLFLVYLSIHFSIEKGCTLYWYTQLFHNRLKYFGDFHKVLNLRSYRLLVCKYFN